MNIWVIADLHLSFGVPNKSMNVYGPSWENHAARIKNAWDDHIHPHDLVLIPGDISWATKIDQALPDLEWIHERPGTKVLLQGNHDLWWDSISKVRKCLPPSLHAIQNDVFCWHNVVIAGSRLWDTDEYSFDEWIDYKPAASSKERSALKENDINIFKRELLRLEMSLQKGLSCTHSHTIRLAMTHYPPIGPELQPTSASHLFKKYGVTTVVFGHLHSLYREKMPKDPIGTLDGVQYILASCDWLQCMPKHIMSL